MISLRCHLSFDLKPQKIPALSFDIHSRQLADMQRRSGRPHVFLPVFNECISPLRQLFFSCPCGPVCEGSEHSLLPSSLGLSAGAALLPGLSYSPWHSDAQITHTLSPQRTRVCTQAEACALTSHTRTWNLNTHFILVNTINTLYRYHLRIQLYSVRLSVFENLQVCRY